MLLGVPEPRRFSRYSAKENTKLFSSLESRFVLADLSSIGVSLARTF